MRERVIDESTIWRLSLHEYYVLRHIYVNKHVPCNSFKSHPLFSVRVINRLLIKDLIYKVEDIVIGYSVTPNAKKIIENFWS